MSLDDIVRFSFAFTAVVTVFGWFIVARQTERRELRKEVRDRVVELAAASKVVEDAATAYWISSVKADAASTEIRLSAAVKRLSRLALSLQGMGLIFDQPELISEIRKAATGGDFGAKNRKHNSSDCDIVADTVGALEDLLIAVDTAFYKRFQLSKMLELRFWTALIIFLVFLRGATLQ